MNKNIESFLTEGLKAYPDARATVANFEQEVNDLLTDVASKRKWHPLKNHRAKSKITDTGNGAPDYWLYLRIEGLFRQDEQVTIEYGVWWHARDIEVSPIIYAYFQKGPDRLLAHQNRQEGSEIRTFLWSGKTISYIPASEAGDIEKSLHMLLDDLLKQMA